MAQGTVSILVAAYYVGQKNHPNHFEVSDTMAISGMGDQTVGIFLRHPQYAA